MKFLNQSIYELQFPLDDHEKYPLRVLKNGYTCTRYRSLLACVPLGARRQIQF